MCYFNLICKGKLDIALLNYVKLVTLLFIYVKKLGSCFFKRLINHFTIFQLTLHSFPYPQNVDEGTNEYMYITILLPLFTMMSFIFFIPVVTRRVVQEKSSGVKVF